MNKIPILGTMVLVSACGNSGVEPHTIPDAGLPVVDAAGEAGGSTVGTPDAPPAAPGCEHVAILCTKLDQCAPFFLKAGYGDLAGCTDRLTKACTEQSKSNGSGLDETSILACAAALSTVSCKEILGNNIPACAFHGTYPDGAICGDNAQCTGGFCNHGGSLCGVCAAKGSLGAACPSGSNDECQTGLVCSSGKLCVQPATEGGICDDSTAPCPLYSFCTTANTCANTVAAGQECPGAYLNLADGTVCLGKSTAANPILAGQIATASVGQPCGLAPGNNLPATLCAPGSVAACTPAAGSVDILGIPTKGICAASIQDGFTCTSNSACMAGALCINGTCQIPSGRYCE